MRKKISISETENDNFRLREIYNAPYIQQQPSALSPSRTHQSLYCVCVAMLMMMMNTKMPMLTKLKLVWNLIWSCHHDDNKVLNSILGGFDDNSFDQFGGRISLRLQRAAVWIVVKCWNHWCLQSKSYHNDIDNESWAVHAGAETSRCTFSFQFSQQKKRVREIETICALWYRKNDFLIKKP